MVDGFFVGIAVMMVIFLVCFGGMIVYKWVTNFYHWIRGTDTIRRAIHAAPPSVQNARVYVEHPLPTYDEATRQAPTTLEVPRRRRSRPNKEDVTNEERRDVDTQIHGETTEADTAGGGGNENGNSHASVENESRARIGQDNIVIFSEVNESAANAEDASGVANSGDDNNDKFDNNISITTYDTASCSSTGGGRPRAPSPWIDF